MVHVLFYVIRIVSFCSDRPADTTSSECHHTDYTEYDFSQRRRYINVSSDCWLEGLVEDKHMLAALNFLKKQFPGMGSIQDILLGSNKDYMGFAAVCSPFVQVLNTHSSHWVTVASSPSYITAGVIVYDSLYARFSDVSA